MGALFESDSFTWYHLPMNTTTYMKNVLATKTCLDFPISLTWMLCYSTLPGGTCVTLV